MGDDLRQAQFHARAPKARRRWPSGEGLATQAGNASWSHEHRSAMFPHREASAHDTSVDNLRIRATAFPVRNTIEDFVFDHEPARKRDTMTQLAGTRYLADSGRRDLEHLIASLHTGIPTALVELHRLGRTLNARANDILAYFDRPGTSNGPTEAINGRLEHLRGTALGFRNLEHYITRSLLEAGGFRPALHP